MARRSQNTEDGVNLDSLMDALTNVVAVLILVLLLVQTDVTNKVVEFLEGLSPATPEQVQESKEKLEELQKQKENNEKLLSEEPPTPEKLEAEKRQLALLEKEAKLNKDLLADLEELKKIEDQIRKEREAEDQKTTKIQEEIARLEALLDDTPIKTTAPTVVSIPISKAVPKNAEIYPVIIQQNRVHFIDPHTPLELFEKEFARNKRDLPHSPNQASG